MGTAAGGLGVAAGGPRAAAGAGRDQAELAAPSPSSPHGLSLSRRLKMKGREKDKIEGSSWGEYGF